MIPLELLSDLLHRVYLQGRADALESVICRIAGVETSGEDNWTDGEVEPPITPPDWVAEWLSSCERKRD